MYLQSKKPNNINTNDINIKYMHFHRYLKLNLYRGKIGYTINIPIQ